MRPPGLGSGSYGVPRTLRRPRCDSSRALALGLAIAGAVSWAAPALEIPEAALKGDLNRDGQVDTGDVLMLQVHLMDPEAQAGALDERAEFAADVAPLTDPDGEVNVADLLVLMRAVQGELGGARPTLTLPVPPPPSDTNPIAGDVVVTANPDSTVHLFVRSENGAVVHLETVTTNGAGSYTFSGVPMLFDGDNEYFAVEVDAEGLAGLPSEIQSVFLDALAAGSTDPIPSPVTAKVVRVARPGSPYQVNADLSIESSGTLVLGPGVEVEFGSSAGVDVDGVLLAFGTEASKVSLTSQSTTWEGIDLTPQSTVDPSYISYAKIEKFAGEGIRVAGSGVIADITIRDTSVDLTDGTRGVNVDTERGRIDLEWSQVFRSPAVASGDGVRLDGHHITAGAQSRISHSKVSGVDTCIDLVFEVLPHRIEYTEIFNCRTGLHIIDNPAEIFPGNYIHDNSVVGIEIEGNAVWDEVPSIHESYFASNNRHVRTRSDTDWRAGGRRRVVDASRNYWNSDEVSTIGSKIDDASDRFAGKGDESGNVDEQLVGIGALVDFTPFRLGGVDGPLEYQFVSGHIDNDFVAESAGITSRKAVGPMLLWPDRSATIAAGTSIDVYVPPYANAPRIDILVRGDLVVEGESGLPVTFKAPDPPEVGQWWGLRFTEAVPSQLAHVVVRHAYDAIRVEGADVAVDFADLALFERGGVVLDSVVDSTSVTNSTITGPLPTEVDRSDENDSIVENIFGIQVIDSYQGCADVPPPDPPCGQIANNIEIKHLISGIHVIGDSDPEIIGNTITENVWNIWLEGVPSESPGTGVAPAPRISLNTLTNPGGSNPPLTPADNMNGQVRFCSVLSGANLCLSNYPPEATMAVIDASDNYWGTEVESEVRDGVHISEGERSSVDVSSYWDGDPLDGQSTIVGGSGVLTALLVNVDHDGVNGGNPNGLSGAVIRPSRLGEQLRIRFDVVDHPSISTVDVQIEIEPEEGGVPAVRTENLMGLPAGSTQEWLWDGCSDDACSGSGQYVAEEAYAFVLTGTADTGLIDRHDPPANVATDEVSGDWSAAVADAELTEPGSNEFVPIDFNSFEGDYLVVPFELEETVSRGQGFSSRVTAMVFERDETSACVAGNQPNFAEGTLVATPWKAKPIWLGQHRVVWDGRDDGSNPASPYAAGEIVNPGPGSPEEDFCLGVMPPRPLRPNHVIVADTTPSLEDPLAPNLLVRSDPFWIDPTYEHSTKVEFTVDQPSTVTLYILPPGETDLGSAVSTTALGQVPQGVAQPVEWRAYDLSDTNNLETSTSGPYTFALEAKLVVAPHLSTVYRGVVQVGGQQ